MMKVSQYTQMKLENNMMADETPKKNFLERILAKLQKNKIILLVCGAFCTMLTVSSTIDPLGGEMARHDRSRPVITGNTFIKNKE